MRSNTYRDEASRVRGSERASWRRWRLNRDLSDKNDASPRGPRGRMSPIRVRPACVSPGIRASVGKADQVGWGTASVSRPPWASRDCRTYSGGTLTGHPLGDGVTHRPHLQGRRNPTQVWSRLPLCSWEKGVPGALHSGLSGPGCVGWRCPHPLPGGAPHESPGNCG